MKASTRAIAAQKRPAEYLAGERGDFDGRNAPGDCRRILISATVTGLPKRMPCI
jgi:hypothetical protein